MNFERLKAWYFRPRPFEVRNRSQIYRWLGVRLYKKAVPSSGEWISKLRGIKRLETRSGILRREALKRYEHQTRIWEGRHLPSAIALQVWALVGGVVYGAPQFWWCTGINLLVNIYPIFVQRYNRIRLLEYL